MSTYKSLIIHGGQLDLATIQTYLAEGRSDVYEIETAATLSDACQALAATPFDVILLDLELPDCSGMDTLKQIRSQAPHTAIVIIHNTAPTQLTRQAHQLGGSDFLEAGSLNGELLRHSMRYSSEQARMEFRLRESEKRFQDFASAGGDWFWEMDRHLTFSYLSDEFVSVTGFEKDAYLGKTLPDVCVGTDDATAWERHLLAMDKHRPVRDVEYTADMDDGGGNQWLRLSGIPMFDADGHFDGYRGMGTDISIQKYDEIQAHRSKDLIEGILRSSLDGYLVLRAVRNVTGKIGDFSFSHVNRRAEELLSKDRQSLMGRLFSKEMGALVDEGIFDLAVQTVEEDRTFDVEYQFDEDDHQSWLRLIGVKLEDGLVITLSDISARKEAERDQRLAQELFHSSADAMMITDEENAIISVNPAFLDVTGYAHSEVIGKNPNFLSSGQHDADFYKHMWMELFNEGRWTGEVWNRRKDGELYVQRMSIAVIRDEKGVVENYVAVMNDTTEQKKREQNLQHKANYDALTGLPNRSLLEDRIEHAFPLAERNKTQLAILFVDLDGFKLVNDTYGHLAGDFILKEVSSRLQACVRESDTVARLGGDEFVILSLSIGSKDGVQRVADHILNSIQQPFEYQGHTLPVGLSIGIALYPSNGTTPEHLIENADSAMYEAKHSGKGVYRFYEGGAEVVEN